MVTEMLEQAFQKIRTAQIWFRIPIRAGITNTSIIKNCWKKEIQQSMNRKLNCLDNAVMENFFDVLKAKLLYLQNFDSLTQFRTEIVHI